MEKPPSSDQEEAHDGGDDEDGNSDGSDESERKKKEKKEKKKKKEKKHKKPRSPSPSEDERDWTAAPPPDAAALLRARMDPLPAVIQQYFGDASERQSLSERIRQSRGIKDSFIQHQLDARHLVEAWTDRITQHQPAAKKKNTLSVPVVRQAWTEVGGLHKHRVVQHLALENFFTKPPSHVPPTTAIWAEALLISFPAQLLLVDTIPNSARTAPIVHRLVVDIVAARLMDDLWARYGAQSVAHEGRRQHLWLAIHCCKQCPTESVSNFKDRFARHVQALYLDPDAKPLLPNNKLWHIVFADNLLPAVRAGAALASKTEIDWTESGLLQQLGHSDSQARASGDLPATREEDYDLDTQLRLELLDAAPPVLARVKQALKNNNDHGAAHPAQPADDSPNAPARGGRGGRGGRGRGGRGGGNGGSHSGGTTGGTTSVPAKPAAAPAAGGTPTPPTCWNCGEKHSFYTCGRNIDQVRTRNAFVNWAKARFNVDIKPGDPVPSTLDAFQALKQSWKEKPKK